MGITVGIDLGTTNSVMAYYKRGNIKVIDNQDSKPLTRSVVHLTENNEVIVGDTAWQSYGGKDPANTVFSIKRFMGRDFDDPTIQEDIGKAPYQVVKGANGEAEVVLRGRRFSPPEISAFILESMKRAAEDSLSDTVEHAVITVPAYFGNRQKDATRLAGDLAGLNVLNILPEPTAAALKYGLDAEEAKTVLVYDLGGGTFDVTVMDINAGIYDDVGKCGDMHLGGDNFDQLIMNWTFEQMKISKGVDLAALNDPNVKFTLKLAAEAAKIRLSPPSVYRTQLVVPGIARVGGKFIDVECELTKNDFQEMIQPLVDLTIKLANEAIHKTNYSSSDIHHILLVGGSTRVPLVKDTLDRIFPGKVIRGELNPMLCVAEGAAIQSNMPLPKQTRDLSNIKECPHCGARNLAERGDCRSCAKVLKEGFVIDVKKQEPAPEMECDKCGAKNPRDASECKECHAPFGLLIQKIPVPIGIELEGGKMQIILDDTMYYPTKEPVTKMLRTAMPNQRVARLPVYEGREEVAAKNTFLGQAEGNLPEGLAENTPVQVALSIDNDGILKVTASLPNRDDKPNSPGLNIDAKINWKNRVTDVPKPKPPKGGEGGVMDSTPAWHQDATKTLNITRAILNEADDAISERTRNQMSELAKQLLSAVEADDENNARALCKQLDEINERYFSFLILQVGRNIAHEADTSKKIGLAKANKLSDAVARAEGYKNQRDWDRMNKVIAEDIMPLALEAIQASGEEEGDGGNLKNLLRQSSGG